MSPVCAEAVGLLLVVLGAVVAVVVWPRHVAARRRREMARAFRWELAPFDSRHVDVWREQLRRKEHGA